MQIPSLQQKKRLFCLSFSRAGCRPSISELEEAIREANLLPVSVPLMAEVRSALKSAIQWTKDATAFMVSVVVCSMKMDTVRGYYLEIAHRILMALLAQVVAWAEGKEAPVNGYE